MPLASLIRILVDLVAESMTAARWLTDVSAKGLSTSCRQGKPKCGH